MEAKLRIVSGADVPEQFHLGRRCSTSWIAARDSEVAGPHQLGGKPSGALWTGPATSRSSEGVRTGWSELYYGGKYDERRRDRMSGRERLQAVGRPERMWSVRADPAAARVVHLDTVAALAEAAERWPGPHGRIAFEAMAADGIDAVWVDRSVLPNGWYSEDWAAPNAAVRAQMYGWDVESVAWLRPDHIEVGAATRVDRTPLGAPATAVGLSDAARVAREASGHAAGSGLAAQLASGAVGAEARSQAGPTKGRGVLRSRVR
ncbi:MULTISPECIES: hypothetical protein [Pimelobacter]|uniref:hypothetical protein n=1 Tax=Pimelobacter TaxID=2044 RepID=UPI001C04AD8F|nr:MULTISPECIES: hypothetical protein [Pimelobacter]MBU2698825.1 hypothetical protein [Pimelobacter sp. 30-1]UUW93015.1 hypothetical protein M0M43_30745 [Pimelobacter simplex]UUW99048.1 hypothetical protein M0M48_30765 [Pimelobacter simplex]